MSTSSGTAANDIQTRCDTAPEEPTMEDDQPQRRTFDDAPQLESSISVSKSGRFVIHRTVITHIKPVAYYDAILRNAQRKDVSQ